VLDLLDGHARLEVLEDGKGKVQVVGLHESYIQSADELMGLVQLAEEGRATGATSANEQSSRSHAILQAREMRAPVGDPHHCSLSRSDMCWLLGPRPSMAAIGSFRCCCMSRSQSALSES